MARFQVVFQGGGAKLGILLAAAEAVYKQSIVNNFEITRISGTSAGAIVACILATGKDPALFRSKLDNLAKTELDKICIKRSQVSFIYNIYKGKPLYDPIVYRQFLYDLFDLGTDRWEKLSDLPKEVFLHSVDIRTRKENIDVRSDKLIADALFDSSALPFIFTTCKQTNGLIDGGLTNNFPSEVLEKNNVNSDAVIGFSFAPQRPNLSFSIGFKGVKEYAGALFATMIDVAANKALVKLKAGNVHYFQTTLSTFDFDRAKKELNGTEYLRYFEEAQKFVDDVVIRTRMEALSVSDFDLSRRVTELHKALLIRSKISIKRVNLIYTCNSLKTRDLNRADNFQVTIEIASVAGPVFTFGVRVADGNAGHLNDPAVSVRDELDQEIGVTATPVLPDQLTGKVPDHNLLLFFHEPLMPAKSYKIYIAAETAEVMFELRNPNSQDSVAYLLRNMDNVDELNLITLLPTWLPEPTIAPAATDLPEGVKWVPGTKLSKQELSVICSPPGGFYAIGWRSSDMKRYQATGFSATRSS